MQNNISSALPKVDGNSVKGPAPGGANKAVGGDTPFNKLLSGAQNGSAQTRSSSGEITSDDTETTASNEQLSADVDIFSDPLWDVGISGKMVPESGQELPVSTFDTEGLDALTLQDENSEGEVLVTWQQSQIDWSRQLNLANAGGSQSSSAPALTSVAMSLASDSGAANGEDDVATSLLAKNDKNAATILDNKLNTTVPTTSASELSKPTTGFASAMQLSAAASSAQAMKAANQVVESVSDSALGLELNATSQLRSADSSAARAPVALTVSQNALTDPNWAQAMSAKVTWMAGNGVHTATMQLHPAELGSIHVQLSVQGDTTSVQIQTQHKDTSDLMERMMPRLHSGMESQGLRLDDVKVSHNPGLNDGAAANSGQQFAGQSAGDRSGAANNGRNGADQNGSVQNGLVGEEGSLIGANSATVSLNNSGVDYYA
ncbi:flagellar hook-length control protein FliK [Zhongshania sp. BJYM1]|uniref:flagellar hook-length control protein FliK n=1 Tax=Zhongshania aquatica TaxID=2965069 RepID=UPI0022B5DDAF|nr:flagellar hook-length control protein FliK [Marortus sp. BJYM1]